MENLNKKKSLSTELGCEFAKCKKKHKRQKARNGMGFSKAALSEFHLLKAIA